MREILFRGAQKVDGSKSLYWHEGSLVIEKDDYTGDVEYYIQNESGSFLVIPETVGQYTGLTDKNGKKIFEDDIVDVAYDIDYGGVAAERIGIFKIVFNSGCFMKRNKKGLFHFIPSDKCTVIGNIHDNPKLLKEAEQE